MPRSNQRPPGPGQNGLATALLAGLLATALMLGAACERRGSVAEAFAEPVASDTSCAADGMLLANHPGPKGQIVFQDRSRAFFCDVREVWEALYDPEQGHRVAKLFVQPIDTHGWSAHPDGWADAREMLYVLSSRRMGHMGPTLVPFQARGAADAFMAEQGGRLVPAADLTATAVAAYAQEVRAALRNMNMPMGHGTPATDETQHGQGSEHKPGAQHAPAKH